MKYKPFIEVDTLNDFKTLKLSVDESDTIYVTYESNVQTFGTPDVKWGQFVCILNPGIIYLKGHFFKDKEFILSSEYAISELERENLLLQSGDTFEEAFGKIEKTIIDNELTLAYTINDLNSKINNNTTQKTKSDWNENDSTSYSYILNKPDLSNFITQETKSNWNENDTSSAAYILNKPDLSNFITQETKSNWNETDTSSAAYIQNKPNCVTSSISGLKIEIVNDLPSLPDTNTIYIIQ